MIVSRRSPLTGNVNEMGIPVTEEQLAVWKGGAMIQDAMPNLTADQREFIMSGYTPEDWHIIFGDEEEVAIGADPAF